MCRYKNYCKFTGKGCNAEDEDTCSEARTLYESLCPLMVASGVAKGNCGCDIPQVRNLWPAGKKCFDGQECLPRRYRQVRTQIQKITDAQAITLAFATTA